MSNPLEAWTEEQRSAFLYRTCAEAEAGTPRADLFTRLAGEAEAQATIWRAQLTASGKPAPQPYAPDLRTRLVARLVALFGPRRLRPVLAAMKVRGMAIYSRREPGGHGAPVAGNIEHRHRGLGGGGNLRAAVMSMLDVAGDGRASTSTSRPGRRGQPARRRVRHQRRSGVEREPHL